MMLMGLGVALALAPEQEAFRFSVKHVCTNEKSSITLRMNFPISRRRSTHSLCSTVVLHLENGVLLVIF